MRGAGGPQRPGLLSGRWAEAETLAWDDKPGVRGRPGTGSQGRPAVHQPCRSGFLCGNLPFLWTWGAAQLGGQPMLSTHGSLQLEVSGGAADPGPHCRLQLTGEAGVTSPGTGAGQGLSRCLRVKGHPS